MSSEKNFTDGMRVSRHEKAPEFVVASIGIKVDDFIAWLRQNQNGEWLNIDIKKSRAGGMYAELNTYKREGQPQKKAENKPAVTVEYPKDEISVEYPEDEIRASDIPF